MEDDKESAFGSHLVIDPTNRLEVLPKIKKEGVGLEELDLPEFIKFSRDIRAKLQESLEKEGWPEKPEEISSVEDLFETAKKATTERWISSTSDLLIPQYKEWSELIPDENLKALLSNPQVMEEKLRIRQFGLLEPLRKTNPDAWKKLLIASSERQLAQIVLVKHWLEGMTDGEVEKLGMKKVELELFTDISWMVGKYVDQAYIKQLEMADQSGGSMESPLKERKGAPYIYELPDEEDKLDIKTYKEIFPFEWPHITRRFKDLSLKTTRMIKEGTLDNSYKSLAFTLKRMSRVYGWSEKDKKTKDDEKNQKLTKDDLPGIDRKWDRLYTTARKTLEADCPINLVPQGNQSVTGEADKIDIEIRMGLHTPNSKLLEERCKLFQIIAQKILDKKKEVLLRKNLEVATPYITYQPFAFGPDLFWMTRGESYFEVNLTHRNAVEDVATATELPLLKKVFAIEDLDEKTYQEAAVLETALHEIGHAVLPHGDKNIERRIGSSGESSPDIIDELKAETVGMHLLNEGLKEGSPVNPKIQFSAKLGTVLDYLTNKSSGIGESGEDYLLTGIGVMDRLLNTEGVLEKTDIGYRIISPEKGIETLAEIGKELIELYSNPKTKPEVVKEYVARLREKAEEPTFKAFLAVLRS